MFESREDALAFVEFALVKFRSLKEAYDGPHDGILANMIIEISEKMDIIKDIFRDEFLKKRG
jgi:hypothetical protein